MILACVFSGCFSTPPPPPSGPSATLIPGSWSGPNLPIGFGLVTGPESIAPSALSYQLSSGNGTPYFNGPAGAGAPIDGVSVAVSFGDTTGTGRLSAGDGLLITLNSPTPETFGNASLHVIFNGTSIAQAVLPAPPPAGSQTSIAISAGAWTNGELSISVDSVTNAQGLPVTGLRFAVFNSASTVYYTSTADNPTTTGGITVNVLYFDTLDAGQVSAGDSMRLAVSPTTAMDLHGGRFSVVSGTQEIGAITIP